MLPNKAKNTYGRMWAAIRGILPPNVATRMLSTDFESAASASAIETSPDASAAFCFFHLGQSVERKVGDLGLRERHLGNEDFRIRVKSLCAFASLPPRKCTFRVRNVGRRICGRRD